MKRKHYWMIGGVCLAGLLLVYLFFPSESSPEHTVERYLQTINQTDFSTDADRALDYVDESELNEGFIEQFKEELNEKIAFAQYEIGKATIQDQQKATVPVTITWNEYWQHTYTFDLALINLNWVIVPDVETVTSAKQLERFAQAHVNYINTFENQSGTTFTFNSPAYFESYLLGVPTQIRYESENEVLQIPVVDEETMLSETIPKTFVSFADGSEVYYTQYYSYQ